MSSEYYLSSNLYDENRYKNKVNFFIKGCLFLVLFFNLVFFISWIVCSTHENTIVLNSSFFSKFFYFLNWNLWKQLIFIGDYSSNINNSIYNTGIVFLISFYISIFSFISGFLISIVLLLLSIYYEHEDKKLLATFYFFPVISTLLYFCYLIHRIILYYSICMPDIINRRGYNETLIKINDYLNNYVSFFYSKKDNIFKKDKYEILKIQKTNCKISELKKLQDLIAKKLFK